MMRTWRNCALAMLFYFSNFIVMTIFVYWIIFTKIGIEPSWIACPPIIRHPDYEKRLRLRFISDLLH